MGVLIVLIVEIPPCVSSTAAQCPEPPRVPNADVLFDTSGIIQYGSVASYRCHFGILIGASDIDCTEDGTWSAPAPRCEGSQKATHIMLPVLYHERVTQSFLYLFIFKKISFVFLSF